MLENKIYNLAKDLFPICRSITGQGVRDSLKIINDYLQDFDKELFFNIHEIKSGTQVFDWTVPDEWYINDAYIITPDGEKICDFKVSNLYVLNYSIGVDKDVSLSELKDHLYTRYDIPDAIPYNTCYYARRWGFCIEYNKLKTLKEGTYHVYIDAGHKQDGVLNYADLVIKATEETDDEIMFTSYICHPSLANNELSGPVVIATLINYVNSLKYRRYNYRFVLGPETIGSIVYINRNLEHLKKHVKAGFVINCLGSGTDFNVVHTRDNDTLADKIAIHSCIEKDILAEHTYMYRSSDERQYASPLVNLPFVCLSRGLYTNYQEYHSSLDNLDFLSKETLYESYEIICNIVDVLEINKKYIVTTYCEPQLGKRGLYPLVNTENKKPLIGNFLAYCDGKYDVVDIATLLKINAVKFKTTIDDLLKHSLIKEV